jgi:hypothetical protein
MVSVDEVGYIIVWRFEFGLFKLCTYKQNFTIDDILFPRFNFERMNSAKVPPQDQLDTFFFFSNSGGVLHLADDSSSSPEICSISGKIKNLLFYEKDHSIIMITSTMLLVKCTIHFQEQLSPKKVKLSIPNTAENIQSAWAGEGLIAIISGDDIVRFFYLETDQAYFLSISDHEIGRYVTEDFFTSVDFNTRKRILSVGSAKGKVYMWKCNATASIIPISAESWEPFCIVDTISDITGIKWSTHLGLIHLWNNRGQHSMLSETILQKKMNNVFKVVQTSHKTLEFLIPNLVNKDYTVRKIEMNDTIKGLDLYNHHVLTWNGNNVYLHEANGKQYELIHS